MVDPAPISNAAMLQRSEASIITAIDIGDIALGNVMATTPTRMSILLCCPVLKPQMTGEPGLPGLVMLKVSPIQSPILPPSPLVAPVPISVVVPAAGLAIWNI